MVRLLDALHAERDRTLAEVREMGRGIEDEGEQTEDDCGELQIEEEEDTDAIEEDWVDMSDPPGRDPLLLSVAFTGRELGLKGRKVTFVSGV